MLWEAGYDCSKMHLLCLEGKWLATVGQIKTGQHEHFVLRGSEKVQFIWNAKCHPTYINSDIFKKSLTISSDILS